MHEFMIKLSKTIMVLVFIVAVVYGWEALSRYLAEQDREEERRSIGTNASVAGLMLAAAYKSCRLIGVPEFTQCAQQSGPLPQDVVAQSLAKTALEQRRMYEAACARHFNDQYCYDLLNRAFSIGLAPSN